MSVERSAAGLRDPTRETRDAAAARPRVGVSSCLLGEPVRYDGGHRRDRWLVAALGRHVEWVPVCPEVEVGLGVPRPTIELRRRGRGVRLVEPSSGRDLTTAMRTWADARLAALASEGLDGFVLKARSPSCGAWGVPVHGPGGGETRDGRGRFAAALLGTLRRLAVEEDEGLHDLARRAAFCERVFASARLRALWATDWRVADLRAFHSRHAWQLCARGRRRANALARLAREGGDDDRERLRVLYTHGFMAVMARPLLPAYRLESLRGPAALAAAERGERVAAPLGPLIEAHARGGVPLRAVLRALHRALTPTRFVAQTLLDPYPEALDR